MVIITILYAITYYNNGVIIIIFVSVYMKAMLIY